MSDYYEIYATVKVRYDVSFKEPMSIEDAKDAFMNDEVCDIEDEALMEIISIDRAEPIDY